MSQLWWVVAGDASQRLPDSGIIVEDSLFNAVTVSLFVGSLALGTLLLLVRLNENRTTTPIKQAFAATLILFAVILGSFGVVKEAATSSSVYSQIKETYGLKVKVTDGFMHDEKSAVVNLDQGNFYVKLVENGEELEGSKVYDLMIKKDGSWVEYLSAFTPNTDDVADKVAKGSSSLSKEELIEFIKHTSGYEDLDKRIKAIEERLDAESDSN